MRRPGGRAARGEFVLAALAVLSLALIPIHLTTIYSGLPAHPLFLHIPVILIPVAAVGGLAFAVFPELIPRWGLALGAVAVAALAGLFLTMGAGSALRDALHLGGGFAPGAGGFGPGGGGLGPGATSYAPLAGSGAGVASLVDRHAHAADILRLLTMAFTAVLIVTVLAFRVASGVRTGVAPLDSVVSGRAVRIVLRVALAVLAIACGYFVFHTGDLGAKAVWQGRLH